MITSAQIRAARALLKWSAAQLAEKAGLSWKTVQRLESADELPSTNIRTLDAIKAALEAAGVVFIDRNGGGPGVRFRK
jgi:DNA-binding Xre family transcriptional regulator